MPKFAPLILLLYMLTFSDSLTKMVPSLIFKIVLFSIFSPLILLNSRAVSKLSKVLLIMEILLKSEAATPTL
ncbi:hypothetical protein MBCUR_06340 [Methanobrevibacter curvatus]|uniref:Uncharacterized protein n=1 Tax=Methanobrevibacter curvatus TaxID=49547 RepID=A0A166C4H9_9EURY|nr:hypothetical protein MBCUR_06340 [Methanobrevibacter curvatus]